MNRKIFLIWTAVLTCALPLPGQEPEPIHYGLKVGLNSSSFAHEEGIDSKNRTGVIAGAFLHIPLAETFGLQVEGLYTQKGSRVAGKEFAAADGRSGSTKIPETVSALDYIEIPVLAKLALISGETMRTALVAGAAFGFRMRNEFELKSTGLNKKTSYGRFTNDRERSWVVGLEIQIPTQRNAVVLEARYTRSATPVFNVGSDDDDSDDQHQVVSIMVGVGF